MKLSQVCSKMNGKKDTSNYAAAAIVSILPGTIEENLLLLDEVRKRIGKRRFYIRTHQ